MASRVEIIIAAKDLASDTLGGISNTLGNIAKVAGVATAALGAAFVALGKQALDATAEWERMEMTMQSLVAREIKATNETITMADALQQATGRSRELLDWIQKLAIQSPFDVEGVTAAFRTALAYGFTSEQAQRLTQNMIDFAAGTGQSTEAMNQIALALGQVRAKGKLAGQEILQLVNAGVPVNDILKKMGFTLDDVSKGLVTSDKFLAAFSETMEKDFGGAAARQTNTWAGLLNSLQDIKKIGLRELFGGIFDALQPLVSKFTEWLQGEGIERLRELGQKLGEVAQKIIDIFMAISQGDFSSISSALGFDNIDPSYIGSVIIAKLSEAWVYVTSQFRTMMEAIDWGELSRSLADKINKIEWDKVGMYLIAGIQNIIMGIVEFFKDVDWAALFDSITLAVAEFLAGLFGKTFDEVRASADAFWADLFAKVQEVVTKIKSIWENYKMFWIALWEGMRAVATGIFSAFVAAITERISSIVNAFVRIRDAISSVIGWIQNLASAFTKLAIPDWLTPGSPTPFELGLLGINDALKKVANTAPNVNLFNASSSALQPAAMPQSTGAPAVNIYIQSPVTFMDEQNAVENLRKYVTAAFRQVRAEGAI